MDLTNRSTSSYVRRNDAMTKWDESDTGRASSIRTLQQITIRFEYGAMLLAAVSAGDTNETLRLLKDGADVNYANIDGLTCLHQACIDENFAIVKILVDSGANIDACDNEGWTPLHAAASSSSLEIIKYLVSKGANIVAVNSEGELPVDLAENPQIERFFEDELRRRGIDVDEAREAEEKRMMEDVERWKKQGKFEDMRDSQGATPLHVAASKGYDDVAKALLSIGADPNARDNDGWTPLHAAVHWKNTDICKDLLANGADPNALNENGETPLKLADDQSKSSIQEIFAKYKINNNTGNLDKTSGRKVTVANYQKSPTKQVVGILKAVKKEPEKTDFIPKPTLPPIRPATVTVASIEDISEKKTAPSRPPSKVPKPVSVQTPPPSPSPITSPSPKRVISTPSRPPVVSNIAKPTSISSSSPDKTPVTPKPRPSKVDSSDAVLRAESPTKSGSPSCKDVEATIRIANLELQISNLKKERESLLKIIDNLRGQLKVNEKQPKNTEPSTGVGRSPSISRPPTRQ